jgi:uncharacterized membrane protein
MVLASLPGMTASEPDQPEPQGNGPASTQTDRRRNRVIANRAFGAIKAQHAAERSLIEGFADALNELAASTPFLVMHVIWFLVWIPWNLGLLPFRPFDPFPFGLLTMVVSLEAIFLSIFVLMAQKRESAIAELREELMLQVNMRMEEEVTKTLQLVSGLYTRLGHVMAEDEELGDMLQPLDITSIERELTEQIAQVAAKHRRARLRRRVKVTGDPT